MDFNHIVIVTAIILIVVDFFIPSDFPTFIAYVLIAFLVSWNLEVPFLYKILIALISWFALVIFHFAIWKNVVQKIVNQYLAPTKHVDGPERLVGGTGKLRYVENSWFIQIDGDLWPCEIMSDMLEGREVQVKAFQDGIIKIK
jgi:membrane protein implicated in regulation of membrane protease activity